MSTPPENILIKTGAAAEAVKAMLDAMGETPGADRRALAVARTHFETGFLWIANSVSGPGILDSIDQLEKSQ